MKKNILSVILTLVIFCSCGGNKSSSSRSNSATYERSGNKVVDNIVANAMDFEGTRYRYAGTTKKGMDCSGLVYTSFQSENIELPRTSRAMATKGSKVSLKRVAIGDLLFFKTNKNKNTINHVGLVVSIKNQIQFIHASVSKGVVVSNLNERYWNNCYVGARRIL